MSSQAEKKQTKQTKSKAGTKKKVSKKEVVQDLSSKVEDVVDNSVNSEVEVDTHVQEAGNPVDNGVQQEHQEAAPVVEEKSAGGKKTKSKKEKKEKAPKKPRAKTAYNFFVSENMKKLMELDEWKDKKNSELMKECGARWKSLSVDDKAPYQKLSQEHKDLLASQQEKSV